MADTNTGSNWFTDTFQNAADTLAQSFAGAVGSGLASDLTQGVKPVNPAPSALPATSWDQKLRQTTGGMSNWMWVVIVILGSVIAYKFFFKRRRV